MQVKVARKNRGRQRKRISAVGMRALDLTAPIRILKQAGYPDPTDLRPRRLKLQSIIDGLCDLCIHDGLTGLVNATFFHAVLSREIDRSSRTGRSCGLLVIDLDHFKKVNDTYGHHTGDLVLQYVASQLAHCLRTMDTAARIGGEEFAMILPECAPEDAVQAAKRIHSLFNPMTVKAGDLAISLTASAGLVWTIPGVAVTSEALLAQGDGEMYEAKRSGRSRLCHPPLTTTEVSIEERIKLNSAHRKPAGR
jgi:diguanylate cyclase (GGDEF)-like protein